MSHTEILFPFLNNARLSVKKFDRERTREGGGRSEFGEFWR